MTTRTIQSDTPDSEILMAKLKELDQAPLHKRSEAALRLAGLTVAAMRRLEVRIAKLEAMSDATNQD